jgi:hypothetical protein
LQGRLASHVGKRFDPRRMIGLVVPFHWFMAQGIMLPAGVDWSVVSNHRAQLVSLKSAGAVRHR